MGIKLGRFRSKSRPRSGRLASRSVEVGQVEKNRPTYNTSVEISGFSVTQILREINFGGSRSSKNTDFFHFMGSEFR